MLGWMVYVLLVSALLAGAAYVGERASLARKAPIRWLWGLCISASLIAPTAISTLAVQLPDLSALFGHDATSRMVPLRQITAGARAPSAWLIASAGKVSAAPGLDRLIVGAWALTSLALILAVAVHSVRLLARKRHWEVARVSGAEVFVAEDIGPAVVGLLGPRIVVPRWLLAASAEEQALVIAHEQSHLEANDAQVLAAAVLTLCVMPWNLPMWWALRRLRRAIEIDCDARVLRRGHGVASYGAALIMVGARQSPHFAVVAGMSESKSFLEKRIETMISKRSKYAWASAAALACLGSVLVASAAEVAPPTPAAPEAGHKEIAVDAKILQQYVGAYKANSDAVLKVTLAGDQLSAKLATQPAFPIFPTSETEFFYKVVDAQLTFLRDAQGRTTSVVLHQNGLTIPMARISDAAAAQIGQRLEQKVKNQTPTPGVQAALSHYIDGLISGHPDYATMSPQLAESTRQQLERAHALMVQLGPVKSF
jgi:Zn-dependent protease with chaperone function